jgi:uncharacterized protein (TIGR02118 family)
MAGAKIIVIYPSPRDVGTFERAYTQEHGPMVTPQNFRGLTRFVASKVVGTPDGSPAPFYRVAELHFPSIEALQAAAVSPSAQKSRRPRRVHFDRGEANRSGRGRGRQDLLRCSLSR